MKEHNIFFKRIMENTNHFFKMVSAAVYEKEEKRRLLKASDAAKYATSHAIAAYASEHLENIFLEAAEQHHIDLPEDFHKDSVLHVLTEAYTFGGHTRCVERWIDLDSEKRTHSCILLAQKADWPEKLKKCVELSGGRFVIADTSATILDNALRLRELASQFECVILHTHPDDPTALLAFGTEDFKRPVVLFNHADHIFWLGVSIADCVADLSSHGRALSLSRRKVAQAEFLGIPVDSSVKHHGDRDSARKNIGFFPNAKIVFSSGSAAKYIPARGLAFYDTLDFLLASDPKVAVVIVGIHHANKNFRQLQKKYPDRLYLLGNLDNSTDYQTCLACADLVLDSFPIGGGTAVIDAINAEKPVLTMNSGQSDFLIRTSALCTTVGEFKTKSQTMLNSPANSEALVRELQVSLASYNGVEVWRQNLQKVLAALPKQHHIHRFDTSDAPHEPTEDQISSCCWIQGNIADRFSIKNLMKKICRIKWKKKRKELWVLGFKVMDRQKIFG